MKKIIALFLCLSLFYQSFGYIVVFKTNSYLLKKEMKKKIKAGLEEAELQCMEFSKEAFKSLNWEKENKEFILNNKFYDIVKSEELSNGNIKLYCIDDNQESKLFESLESEVHKNTDIEKNGNASAKKILKLLKIQALITEPKVENIPIGITIPMKEHQYPTSTLFKLITTPPPQIV